MDATLFDLLRETDELVNKVRKVRLLTADKVAPANLSPSCRVIHKALNEAEAALDIAQQNILIEAYHRDELAWTTQATGT